MIDAWPIVVDRAFGCHLWVGKLTPNGYAMLGAEMAYRVAYERAHGPIAPDHVVDHLCRRRRCVNELHLEAVTKSENERRKAMKYRLDRKTCRRGHALNEATRVVTPEMGLLCRVCATEAAA